MDFIHVTLMYIISLYIMHIKMGVINQYRKQILILGYISYKTHLLENHKIYWISQNISVPFPTGLAAHRYVDFLPKIAIFDHNFELEHFFIFQTKGYDAVFKQG